MEVLTDVDSHWFPSSFPMVFPSQIVAIFDGNLKDTIPFFKMPIAFLFFKLCHHINRLILDHLWQSDAIGFSGLFADGIQVSSTKLTTPVHCGPWVINPNTRRLCAIQPVCLEEDPNESNDLTATSLD